MIPNNANKNVIVTFDITRLWKRWCQSWTMGALKAFPERKKDWTWTARKVNNWLSICANGTFSLKPRVVSLRCQRFDNRLYLYISWDVKRNTTINKETFSSYKSGLRNWFSELDSYWNNRWFEFFSQLN